MDPNLYKQYTVSRGFNYSYYYSPAADTKPTLLFAHGFPSTSADWRHQVAYFKPKGYGLIVPDMLGYAATDRPTDTAAYISSRLATDLVEIAEAELGVEGLSKVVVIGHDWGSHIISRLPNLYPGRFLAFAFLCVGYNHPDPNATYEAMKEGMKAAAPFEPLGYWEFFSSPEAPRIMKEHIDSFYDILYPRDCSIWIKHLGPTGTLQAFLESDARTDQLDVLTSEDRRHFRQTFLEKGFEGPVNYYKVMTSGLNPADAAKSFPDLPKENITTPALFIGATKDILGDLGVAMFDMAFKAYFSDYTLVTMDAGHWIQLELADQVNSALEAWVESKM